MPALDIQERPFRPGMSGWTVEDLQDPQFEHLWLAGRYELVDGVIAEMPPAAYYSGGDATVELIYLFRNYAEARKHPIRGSVMCDIVLSEDRIAKADGILMRRDDLVRSREIALERGRTNPARQPIYFPPIVIIESISPGHEAHDRKLKRRWYAEFGVPNYWMLDAIARRLDCLSLKDGAYVEDCAGRNDDLLRPASFPGFEIPLSQLWA